MAQGQHEQDEADAVAEEADQAGAEQCRSRRQRRALESKARARLTAPATRPLTSAICTGSAAESLRVRLLSMPQARQAPAISKRRRDRGRPRPPCQDSSTAPARIGEGARQQAAVDILAEDQPGDRHRGEALEIEQQGRRRIGAGEAEHQQQRPDHAAGEHDGGEPGQVSAAQRRLGRAEPQRDAPIQHAPRPSPAPR